MEEDDYKDDEQEMSEDDSVKEVKKEHKKHEEKHEGKSEHKKHEAHKEHYLEHEQHRKHKTYETAAWTLGVVAIILVILFIAAIVTKGFSGNSGNGGGLQNGGVTLTADQVKAKAIGYVSQIVQGQTVTIDSITDTGSLYSVKLNIGGRPYDSYVTKDGKLLFPSGIDMTQPVPAANAQAPTPTTVPKTDKPKIELFVMAYCPYGTQSEKGILPAIRTLGDKVDFSVRFVYYAMHGEKEVKENLNQYCIQSEQNDKYLKYLACFLNSTDSGSDASIQECLTYAQVDTTKLDACKTLNDAKFNVTKNWNDKTSWLSGNYPLFSIDAALNTKYSVGGSPTLIINGAQSNAGRDPASYLAGICGAFNTPPAECQTKLDSASPSAGFGYGTAAAATAAGCGV